MDKTLNIEFSDVTEAITVLDGIHGILTTISINESIEGDRMCRDLVSPMMLLTGDLLLNVSNFLSDNEIGFNEALKNKAAGKRAKIPEGFNNVTAG